MKSLNRQILRLACPAIVSNLTVPLLGISDTAISGHLGSATYIAAISVGAMMMDTVFWLFGFLRMGTTGLTAQAWGAADRSLCLRLLQQSVMLAATIGLVMALAAEPLLRLLTTLIAPDPEVAEAASTYFRICICAAPAQLATMAILGWMLGMQDTLRPMIISVSTNVINIAASLTLVIACHLGFKGVAIGTLVANWAGLLLAILLAVPFMKRRGVRWEAPKMPERRQLARFFSVNTDIFFRSACIMGVSLAMTSIGARIGITALAANALMMQFFIFFSYFMDGLAFTGEALIGRFHGAGDRPMMLSSVRHLLWWSAAVAVIFFLIYTLASEPIMHLLTDQEEVIEFAMDMRLYVVLLPPVTVMAFVFDGFYIGLTATRRMLVVTAAAAAVFFALALFRTGRLAIPTDPELWQAFLAYLFVRGVLLAAMSPRIFSTRQAQ